MNSNYLRHSSTETLRCEKSEAGTKVLAPQLFLDCRARRSG